jgi:hypothetical protein
MYRYYNTFPEFNKRCVQASRTRAYEKHKEALKHIRTCIDTSPPYVRHAFPRDSKRKDHEEQPPPDVPNDNKLQPLRQRPFTLLGQAQKDEMSRITQENRKLLVAVQVRPPVLNREDWRYHVLDHRYQIAKMSEYKKTVPMAQLVRQEQRRSGLAPLKPLKKDDSRSEEGAGASDAEVGSTASG